VNATKRPSAVSGLRRGVGTTQAGPAITGGGGSGTAESGGARPSPPPPPPRPEKPVRFTLDLDQDRHAFLKTFALECGPGVGGAQVLRALLDELREGSNLPVRVKARIWAAGK
jgi:hypothetical protein